MMLKYFVERPNYCYAIVVTFALQKDNDLLSDELLMNTQNSESRAEGRKSQGERARARRARQLNIQYVIL